MLSMANVNRIVWKFGFLFIILLYVAFLVYEDAQWNDGGRLEIIRNHKENIERLGSFDGLVLGGSNAMFSLSALQLSESTGLKWYNAAVLNEGYSYSNYQKFISNTFSKEVRSNVKLVAYSTIHPYRVGAIEVRRKYEGGIDGKLPLSIRPYRQIFSYLKELALEGGLKPTTMYPVPTVQGDFLFQKYNCATPPSADIKYEREDVVIAATALAENILVYQRLFPKAKMLMVLPSEFYGDKFDDAKAASYNNDLIFKVTRILSEKDASALTRLSFISQPPFLNANLICDALHHANRAGRKWRTRNLISQL